MDINDPAFAKTIGDEDYDKTDPSSGMSIKVYAAIHLKVPDSGIQELDAMIRKAKRDEFCSRALHLLISDTSFDLSAPIDGIVGHINKIADAMLEQSENG